MKIVAIADTHGFHNNVEVPDGDVMIFAGDMCMKGDLQEVTRFSMWLDSLPHKHKIVVAGNHDWPFVHIPRISRGHINATYLQDESCEIDGVNFYGSPYTPEFCGWAFMLPRGNDMMNKWSHIPDNTDVLITHGPPINVLDETLRHENAGCFDLGMAIERVRPNLHLFGHIHKSYGIKEINGITHINCSACDESYDPTQDPVVFEMEV